MKVLFLSVYHPESENCSDLSMFTRAWNEIKNMPVEYEWLNIEDAIQKKHTLKADVICPFYADFEEEKFAPLVLFLKNKGFLCTRFSVSRCVDKNLSAMDFKLHDILHPQTLALDSHQTLKVQLKNLKFPCVFKPSLGSKGEDVVVVHNKSEVEPLYKKYKKNGGSILQEIITPTGQDIRAFVIGTKVLASMVRKAPKGELVTNYSKHKSASQIDLKEVEKNLAVRAVKVFNLPYAGVDLMRHENGNTYVIEVNARPGIDIEKVTDVNIAHAWLDYFIKQKKHPQNESVYSV